MIIVPKRYQCTVCFQIWVENPDRTIPICHSHGTMEEAKPGVADVRQYEEFLRRHDMEGQLDKLEGKKHDGGKPPLALLSSSALIEVAKVLEFGAKKYDSWNWKGGFKWSRLASAVLRHIFAWLGGEDKDPETGLSHLAHAMCGLMFLLDFEVNKLGEDDRYKAIK